MAAAYAAGASDLPFGVLRGYRGTDLAGRTPVAHGSTARSPASGSLRCRRSVPTSGSSTRSRPMRPATSSSGASRGVQKEAVLASARSIVTVEEIVPELELRPGGVVLPGG